jgi:hypothetical protein
MQATELPGDAEAAGVDGLAEGAGDAELGAMDPLGELG